MPFLRHIRTRARPRGAIVDRGQFVVLDMRAATGIYTVAGQDAALAVSAGDVFLIAAQGSYSVAGQDALLLRAARLDAEQGSYAVAGQDANLARIFTLAAEQGTYGLTGQEAAFLRSLALAAEQGTYSVSGQDAALVRQLFVAAEWASYTVAGQDAALFISKSLVAEFGQYVTTGQDAALFVQRLLAAEHGIYSVSGQDANLRRDLLLAAAMGSYAASGQDAVLARQIALVAAQGSYSLSGQDATLTYTTAGSLTPKGYGHIYGASSTANLALSYANVDSGSAPAAGNLVVWCIFAVDSTADPIQDLTGSGWQQVDGWDTTSDIARAMLAKVVVSGDVSSPPTIISGPTGGSIGFWAAYTVTGTIASLSISALNWENSGNSAPSNQTVNSSALNSPDVAISIGAGGGDDGSPSMSISGATADINFTSAANVWGASGSRETQFLVNATVGGANITFSKGDDGGLNLMASAYVTVDF